MLSRGLAPERVFFGERQMAVRFWSSSLHGLALAGLPRVRPSCQLLCHFSSAKASIAAFTQGRDHANPAAAAAAVLEESLPGSSKKKRLSRQERTALVESFVLKHMEAHQGAFPSVSVVLKGTGGGRNVVSDILSDLEGRFAGRNLFPKSMDMSGTGEAASGYAQDEDTTAAPSTVEDDVEDDPAPGDPSADIEVSASSSDDSKGGEDSEDIEDREEEEVDSAGVIGGGDVAGGSRGRQEVERKSVTLTNGQMIGSSQGEIETHSGLWSRLRGLGTSQQSLGQASKQQPLFPEAPPSPTQQRGSRRLRPAGGHLLSDTEFPEENGRYSGSVALSYANTADSEVRNSSQNGSWKDESSEGWPPKDPSADRHGLFVRYLSPQATPADMREAFADCGEIVRAQAVKSRTNSKYTYGFVDFKTFEALQKALDKEKVYIKGVRIQKEPSSSTRRVSDKILNSNAWPVDFRSSRTAEQSTGSLEAIRGSGYKVAVAGIPMHIPLSEVQKALSKYGEIVLSDMKQDEPGAYSANLEFKTDDAREKALWAKSVQLNGMQYSISRVDSVKTTVVRLSNVGSEVNDDQIGATCELFGQVEKVVTRCDGTVDVYFQSTETENMARIRSRLNEVTMEGQRWQAQPAPCLAPGSYESLLKTRDGQEWLQLESERMLTRVESALKKLVVDVEDLQELVKANRNYLTAQRNGRTSPGTSSFF